MIELLVDGPEHADRALVLAHGAGAPMDSPFMAALARGVAELAEARVVRFEFPYMAQRRETGRKRAPDPPHRLLESWREAVAELGDARNLCIGGKSLGGRIASMVADELGVGGLVVLGYPFHPPGRPEKLRTAHLRDLKTRTLICQGERDAFGDREDVASYDLATTIEVCWIPDGDHSFKPRVRSGTTLEANLQLATAAVARFLRSI